MGQITAEKIKERIKSHLAHDNIDNNESSSHIEFASTSELLLYLFKAKNNESFLSSAYQAILKRPPDPVGHDKFMADMNHGRSKAFILNSIANSYEARFNNFGFKLSIFTIYSFLIKEKVINIGLKHASLIKKIPIINGVGMKAYGWLKNEKRGQGLLSSGIIRILLLPVSIVFTFLTWLYLFGKMPFSLRNIQSDNSLMKAYIQNIQSDNSLMKAYIQKLDEQNMALAQGLSEFIRNSASENSKLPGIIRENSVISIGNNVMMKLEGFIMAIPGEDMKLTGSLTFYGKLEAGLVDVFKKKVKEGMVVVDVGAHIGILTLISAKHVGKSGRVYSFEPTPRTFRLLMNNVETNGFIDRVKAYRMAVMDKKSTMEFSVYEDRLGLNTLFPESGDTNLIKVDTISLDAALAIEPRIDIVKIDAEGAEPFILRGMTETIRKNPHILIFIEFAPQHLRRAGIDVAGFIDELQGYGFSIQMVDDMTGEFLEVSREELINSYSVNLVMKPRK